MRQKSCCVFIHTSICSHLHGVTQGVDSEDKLHLGFVFFKYFPLSTRNVEWDLESEKDRWNVQGPEVVEQMAKAGTGCLCCFQESWSSLLEARGVGRAGVRLAVPTPFMAEPGELSRAGELCTFLVLCPQNFFSSSSSHLGRPPETVNEIWDISYRCLSHQSRVSGGIRAALILSSHQYWDACQTGLEMQSL